MRRFLGAQASVKVKSVITVCVCVCVGGGGGQNRYLHDNDHKVDHITDASDGIII